MSLEPAIAIHVTAALGALATGPVALWARKGRLQRPRLHRAFGYAWVTLMIVTAISALFIHGSGLPNIAGFSPIHLLVPVTLFGLLGSFVMLARGNIAAHRLIMQRLYFGACVVAGLFTLLPGRFLGELVLGEWLGLGAPVLGSMLPQILARTPVWVWGLLAALLALGWSQVRERQAGLVRITIMPVAMTALSLWGTVSAFGGSPLFGYTMLAWMFAAAVMLAAITPTTAPRGTAYDPATRTFALPGSWIPMVLILGIFITKYAVGVALAMNAGLARDGQFTLLVGALYGLFSGVFMARSARLWVLAWRATPAGMPALTA